MLLLLKGYSWYIVLLKHPYNYNYSAPWRGANGVLDFAGVTVGVRESESADQIRTREVLGGRRTYNSR